MRRTLVFFLLILALTLPVGAVSGISSADSETLVNSNGVCTVNLTLTLVLEEPRADLTFPLPAQARDITLNGSPAQVSSGRQARNVDLSPVASAAGTYTLQLHYTLPDAVADVNGKLTLTVPLLSGFSLPIEKFTFEVTLPGAPEYEPVFQSAYYNESVGSMVDVRPTGEGFDCTFLSRVVDNVSLTMTLRVTKEMFPQPIVKSWSMDFLDLLMIGVALLALVYWLAAIPCRIPRGVRCTTPPEGITAGEVGCRLTGQGVDLTLMVISWAQMGYILIQYDDNGRVLLHKRMDMGNERSEFENRYFRNIFGRKRTADATGFHYARLCRKAQGSVTGRKQTYARRRGSIRVFRVVAALVCALSGVSFATALTGDTSGRILLGIVLGIGGLGVGWLVQSAVRSLHNRNKLPLVVGAVAALVWVLLSILAGEPGVALIVVALEYLAGIGAFFGGRRTESGIQTAAELLGLRRYMRKAQQEELKRLLKMNPQYYYDLAPYALALDADRALARQLGNVRLPQCPYLTTGMDGHMTPREWDLLLRDTVHAMDALQKRLPLDRLLGK